MPQPSSSSRDQVAPARRRGAAAAARLSPGARAGIEATVAMSLAMLAAKRAGFRAEQPPERIVEHVLDVAGVRRPAWADRALGAVAHLGYGAALGALYAAVTPGGSRPRRGVAFGLAQWTLAYAGWIPVAGIMPPPHRDERGRQLTMVAAHALFGAVLGGRLGARTRRAAVRTG